MAKSIITHNPFEGLPDFRKKEEEKKELTLSIDGAYIEIITKDVIDKIDYEDRNFVNRQKSYDELFKDVAVEELTESIYYAGLINPIYLQIRADKKYRVLSGYRRSIAIKNGYENYEGYEVKGNVIIVPENAPKNELELISLHENIYREGLKVIELAFKINKDAKESGKTLEELSEDYGMSTRQLKRIKGALSYDQELKDILDTTGIKKAELLNRIIKILKPKMQVAEILDKYKEFTASDLENELKHINIKSKNREIILDRDIKKTIVKINKSLNDEQFKRLEEFLKTL